MKSISEYEFARKIALDLLSRRPRSEGELRAKLAERAVPQDHIDALCSRFVEVGLLDDEQFAQLLVQSRSQVSGHGRARIRQELRAKGISDDLTEAALDVLSDEDELTAARAVAEKKRRALAGLEPHVQQRRLTGVLARRGFAPSVVMRCVREVLDEWNG